jgi:N-methylhydantoinase B
LYVASNGGGGYLDPLQRDPEALVRDVRHRVVSPEAARRVYGTVITEEGDSDAKATAELRRTMIVNRRKGSVVT